MKRQSADLADSPIVTHRGVAVTRRTDGGFSGHVVLVRVDAVTDRWSIEVDGSERCIADTGWCWVRHFPKGTHHVVTAVFDDRLALVLWQVDIVAATGVGMTGIPWFEPLPVHVIVTPDRSAHVVGVDSLDAAVDERRITSAHRRHALDELDTVVQAIAADVFAPLVLSERHLDELLPFVT